MGLQDLKRIGVNRKSLIDRGNNHFGANGKAINTLGRIRVVVKYGQRAVETTFIVTDQYRGTLLNRQACIIPNRTQHSGANLTCNHRTDAWG